MPFWTCKEKKVVIVNKLNTRHQNKNITSYLVNIINGRKKAINKTTKLAKEDQHNNATLRLLSPKG